ncbi:condensation domain-containing protein, partial [Corynebacterium bovis]
TDTAGDTAADPDAATGTTGTPAPAPGDVLAVCHHAVVDSVSWMIVEDDLRAAVAAVLDGTDPDAATTTEAVPLRAAAVADLLGAHGPFLDDLAHWRALHALPRPVPDAVRWPAADTVTVRASVAGDVARTLHDAAPEILGVTVQDIVTGVVSAAVSRALGGPAATGRPGGPGGPGDDDAPNWAVDVEGHGRPDDTDVSRTVGWFTTVAPVALPAGDDPVAAAVAAARARAGHADGTLPDRRGHLALRHLHPGAAAELAGGAQILVNYLGRGESDAVLPAPTVEQGADQRADQAVDHATDQGVDHCTDHIVEADVWTTSAGDLAADLTVVASVLAQHGVDPRDLAAHVRDLCGELVGHVHGVVDHGTREVPLTVLQRGIYFQSQVAPAGAYVAQTELVLDHRLDPEALVRAFRDTVTVHPAMGASFGTDADGRPVQHLPWTGRRVTLPVTVVEAADRERAGGLDAVREADRHTAFDTAAAPLARATVIRGRDGEPGDTLLFTYHLVLIDGWSRAIMLRTLLERLTAWTRALGGADGAPTAPAAPTPARPGVADVVRDLAAAADPEADVAYWVDRLAGLPAPTTVADGDGAAETADLPHQVHVDLGREWTARLTATLRDLGATLTSAVTAATGLTLGVATGETDVVFGQSVSGRDLSPDPAVDGVVGLLLNTVPARVTPRPGQSLADLVAAAHRDRVDAMPHDGVDLGDVQRATGWDRLLDSIVVVQNFLDPAAAEELRREHGVVAESAEDSTHFPLTWVFTPGESLHLKIEHRADLVDADRARALADTVTAVLKAVAEDPSQPVAGAVPVDAATAAALPDRGTLAAWQGLPVEGVDAALPPAGTPAVPDAGAAGA